MAIRSIGNKIKYFQYEDDNSEKFIVGVREARVSETKEILNYRSKFIESQRDASRIEMANPSDYAAEGDIALLIDMQGYVAETLCCDPDSPSSLWFTPGGNKISDVPTEFLIAAYNTFSEIPNKHSVKKDGTLVYPDFDKAEVKAAETAPLSPTASTSEKEVPAKEVPASV